MEMKNNIINVKMQLGTCVDLVEYKGNTFAIYKDDRHIYKQVGEDCWQCVADAHRYTEFKVKDGILQAFLENTYVYYVYDADADYWVSNSTYSDFHNPAATLIDKKDIVYWLSYSVYTNYSYKIFHYVFANNHIYGANGTEYSTHFEYKYQNSDTILWCSPLANYKNLEGEDSFEKYRVRVNDNCNFHSGEAHGKYIDKISAVLCVDHEFSESDFLRLCLSRGGEIAFNAGDYHYLWSFNPKYQFKNKRSCDIDGKHFFLDENGTLWAEINGEKIKTNVTSCKYLECNLRHIWDTNPKSAYVVDTENKQYRSLDGVTWIATDYLNFIDRGCYGYYSLSPMSKPIGGAEELTKRCAFTVDHYGYTIYFISFKETFVYIKPQNSEGFVWGENANFAGFTSGWYNYKWGSARDYDDNLHELEGVDLVDTLVSDSGVIDFLIRAKSNYKGRYGTVFAQDCEYTLSLNNRMRLITTSSSLHLSDGWSVESYRKYCESRNLLYKQDENKDVFVYFDEQGIILSTYTKKVYRFYTESPTTQYALKHLSKIISVKSSAKASEEYYTIWFETEENGVTSLWTTTVGPVQIHGDTVGITKDYIDCVLVEIGVKK